MYSVAFDFFDQNYREGLLTSDPKTLIIVHYDNEIILLSINDPKFHERMKHVDWIVILFHKRFCTP